MQTGRAHALHVEGTSPLHRMRPECKVGAHVGFVLAVVATPREAFWAFGIYAAAVLVLSRVGGLPLPLLVRRLAIETPFVVFALLLPVVGQGPRTEVLGMSLAVEGLWGAWNILAKATLGVAASVLLAATTPVADLLRGLGRLRVPGALVAVAGFMVRYIDVVTEEMHRMRIARVSRCHDPRWLWQAKAVAATIGTLFVRSYERGERVYLAMLSRGYAGSLPALTEGRATAAQWASALALPLSAGVVALAAWTLRGA